MDLAKTYDPKTVEPQANRVWTDEKLFHAEPTDPGTPYAIVIPPPNVTAALHLGHALNNTLQDILIRWRRMAGDNTVWMPGTDHAGIATQTVVEKRVLAEEGKRRTDFPREVFVAKIQAWKDQYERRITEQLKAMGCSCDWERQSFTMDEARARAVREAFFQLFKDGLIYRGKRLVNWDPATQTALSDDEVEMEEIDGHFYYLKYPVVEESSMGVPPMSAEHGRDGHATYVTVATTRPETMLGDTAVAINPKDPRAAALRGKKVRLPIVNRLVPIIEDDYVVLPDAKSDDPKAQFATGFLKVTPAHDPNDYEIGQRHSLPMINILAPDGTISDQHGWPKEDFAQGEAGILLGLDRFEARKAVVEWFRQNGLLEEVKPYRHSVGHSYRSHVPIEPYLSDQWYCRVTDERLSGAALRAMGQSSMGVPPMSSSKDHGRNGHATETWQGQLKFYPARYAKTFQTWHENIRDWCISRQLWWGHRIPVWKGPEGSGMSGKGKFTSMQPDLAIQVFGDRLYACIRGDDITLAQSIEAMGFERDPDVLDTWFSSGLWPMSVFGWPEESQISDLKSALNTWNPTHTLCTAREIITLWVSRMVMFNLYFLDRLPFSEVFVHAMIQDGEGRKMSKSLGNGVDPLDIIDSHGADAMRFTLTLMTTQTQDVRMPVEKDPQTGRNTSPKFDIGRNFCNKIWNAVRFALMNLSSAGDGEATAREGEAPVREGEAPVREGEAPAEPNPARANGSPGASPSQLLADRWILSRFNRTVQTCDEALRDYRFDQYAKTCYDFFWGDLCDWYLEAIKPAMKDPARAPQTAQVLAAVIDGSLRLLHPMIPFITETLWWKLNEVCPNRGVPGRLECPSSERLIKAAWPKAGEFSEAAEAIFAKLQETIGSIRNLRNEHKVDPKKTVDVTIVAPAEPARQIETNRELIESLAACRLKQLGPNASPPQQAARASAAGVEIHVEGLVDQAAEQQRSAKRCEELKKTIAALRGRLSNEAYTKKAPPHLVKQTQEQLAEAEAEFARCAGSTKS